eukprot:gene5479-10936_t
MSAKFTVRQGIPLGLGGASGTHTAGPCFGEAVDGASWANCGSGDDVVMHFPDPHGKGFPTQLSLTDWGGDSTDSIGGRLDLNGMVFSNLRGRIDGLDGSGSLITWNNYPQYYVSPFVCNCGANSKGLPQSQMKVTIRLDCCKATTKVTWGTPGTWSEARGLGSKCGLDTNGFPNGVRKRLVKCGDQSDCQTCKYTDETDTKPATLEAYAYACGTVAPTTTTPCPNVPHTITAKTKISCSTQGTQYIIGEAVCGATLPCKCDGNNQGSTILDKTEPCCNWQGSLGATLPGTKCGQQPKAWPQPEPLSTPAVAVPVVLLLLLTIVIIVYALRRQQEKAQQNQFFQPAAPTRRTSARTNSNDELEQNASIEMFENPLRASSRSVLAGNGSASNGNADGDSVDQAGAEGSDGYLVVHQSGDDIYTYAPPAGGSAGAPAVQYAVPLDLNEGGGAEATYQVPALRPAFVGASDGNVETFILSTRPVPDEVYSAPSSTGSYGQPASGTGSSNANTNSSSIVYAVPVEDDPSAMHYHHVVRTPNIMYAPFDPDALEGIPGGVQRLPNPLYNSDGGAGNAQAQEPAAATAVAAAVSIQTSGVPANNQVYAQPLNTAAASGPAGSPDADTYTGYEAPADSALDAERPDHNNTYDRWGVQHVAPAATDGAAGATDDSATYGIAQHVMQADRNNTYDQWGAQTTAPVIVASSAL